MLVGGFFGYRVVMQRCGVSESSIVGFEARQSGLGKRGVGVEIEEYRCEGYPRVVDIVLLHLAVCASFGSGGRHQQ